MTTWNTTKNPETFERRVRQAYADYYRHAETYEKASTLMRECGEYGVTMAECFDLCNHYNAEMREFYRDTATVMALMACSH